MMAVRRVLAIILCVLGVCAIPGAVCQDCEGQVICGDCINEGCAWCYDETFVGISRCQTPENITQTNCGFVANPDSSIVDTQLNPEGVATTIDIETIRLSLSVGVPQVFTVTVTPQPNLPLDLYILIDLSSSMQAELDAIVAIAGQIAGGVSGVTSNVQLGFGSFNDKPVAPFSRESIDPAVPIPVDLYAVRHSVNFTSNSTTFADDLKLIMLSANVDPPENGLEGLAQVITCESIIGWRPRPGGIGTRVVLYMTDDEYHFAGEGRFAGILTPYDGGCYLERNSENGNIEFVRSTEFDYPSPGQILDILQRYETFVIFAATEERDQTYRTLANLLNANTPRASVFNFTVTDDDTITDPSLILAAITEEYERLLQQVNLDLSAVDSSVTLSVVPTCPAGSSQEGDGCASVALQSPVVFEITATLNTCEGLVDEVPTTYTIATSSFGTFNITIIPNCNCECGREGTFDEDQCSGYGVLRCGVCECEEGRCGPLCSIDVGTDDTCYANPDDEEVCSGRGECTCNCICTQTGVEGQLIDGDFCECDNFRCLLDANGEVCSGRGDCCNGMCYCDVSDNGNLYRGEPGTINNCQCEPEEEACVDPVSGLLCNGIGTCGCNFCDCTNTNYTGNFCDIPDIRTCGDEIDTSCISQCRDAFSNSASLPDICDECNSNRPLLFVNSEELDGTQGLVTILQNVVNERLNREEGNFGFAEGACLVTLDNCENEYYILDNTTHYAVVAVREEICSGGINLPFAVWALAPIILGCLFALFILALILIKIIFTILDYLEVKKWEKDAQGADFSKNLNPLYQSPEMKYDNVAYGKE